jgi:hypothetical protein
MRSAQVHISYLSKQLNAMVSEQMIYELFSNFGKVLEVSLKKKCVDTVIVLSAPCMCHILIYIICIICTGNVHPKWLWIRSLSINQRRD